MLLPSGLNSGMRHVAPENPAYTDIASERSTGLNRHTARSFNVTSWRPVDTSHTRAVPSSDAVTTRVPSELNDAPQISIEWPRSVASTSPVCAFQIDAVDPSITTTRAPSWLNDALRGCCS